MKHDRAAEEVEEGCTDSTGDEWTRLPLGLPILRNVHYIVERLSEVSEMPRVLSSDSEEGVNMEIEGKRFRCKLIEVDNGDCFEWADEHFIKLAALISAEDCGYYTCVNLENGEPIKLGMSAIVFPLDAKVVV